MYGNAKRYNAAARSKHRKTFSPLDQRRSFRLSKEVFEEVKEFIGEHEAERGGMIGRDPDGVIRHFEPDYKGRMDAAAYDPDIEHMNRVIKEWKKNKIEFCGFIHSHPRGILHPSEYDRWYSGQILANFKKLEEIWIPIVQTIPDTGDFDLIPYAAVPSKMNRSSCRIESRRYEIDHAVSSLRTKHTVKHREVRTNAGKAARAYQNGCEGRPAFGASLGNTGNRKTGTPGILDKAGYHGISRFLSTRLFDPKAAQKASVEMLQTFEGKYKEAEKLHKEYFSRLASHYDLRFLDRVRLVVVGTGGGASLVMNSARMGIGEFVLIDPDVITKTNIGTQSAHVDTVGRNKVDALGKEIVKTNPKAGVATLPFPIEEIDDEDFAKILESPIRFEPSRLKNGSQGNNRSLRPVQPKKTVLLVLTDNFYAQARGHRLGLHFGVPTICAQEYREGIGAEVTYTVPGITSACHRCITASRYKAYLEENFENNVTSDGAPIFAAEYLNAVLGHMLLAVVHYGTDHPRWGGVIEQLGDRNLLRLRMDGSFDEVFGNVFGRRIEGAVDKEAFRMFDTLFLHQTPDRGQSPNRPVCPDCGGTGDLRDSIGAFENTEDLLPNRDP